MSEFGRALESVLLLGAARAACQGDPERLARLRATEQPLRAAVARGAYDEADRIVRGVMPAGWEPPAEWRLQP